MYEAHDYSKVAEQFDFAIISKSGTAGGLRIKEIRNIENGKTSTRTFEYLDSSGKSSGILSGDFLYHLIGKRYAAYHYKRWWGIGSQSGNYTTTYYIMQENHINQLSTTNGNHVTYSRIIEKLSDGSQTVYTYSNHEDFMDETPVMMLYNINEKLLFNSFISKELERGLLLKTEYMNNEGLPIRTEINTYNSDPNRYRDFVKSINQMMLFNGFMGRLSALKIYTFYPYLESKTTIIRDIPDQPPLTSITRFEYNDHKLLAKTSTSNSKGEEEVHMIRYTGDIDSGVYIAMKDKNMLSFPVEKTNLRNHKVIQSELSTYKKNDKNKDYVPDKIYRAKLDAPLAYEQFVPFTGISMDPRYTLPEIEYTKYDFNSNIEEYVTKDAHVTNCIWGYNSQYPIAIFENARNDYKETSQYEDVRTSKWISLNPVDLYQNNQTYKFTTSRAGTVEISLSGALGYNWYVNGNWYINGNLAGQGFGLVQTRNSDKVGLPWSRYKEVYNSRIEFYAPAGSHTLTIFATDVYRGSTGYHNGELYYTYWGQRLIEPEITGSDNFFYEGFEKTYAIHNVVPFGFHSSKSHSGPYTVNVFTHPEKEYTIDYQVFKDGKWIYISRNFENGSYTINEGNNPIDEIRVYPQDAIASTFTYIPFVGLRSQTNERGITESYEYDPLGRLIGIRDNSEEVVKAFEYKYYNQPSEIYSETYYSIELKKKFINENCDSLRGEITIPIEYMVPEGKYTSSISQEDANKKAYDDLINNGQQYANEYGECRTDIILSVYNFFDTTHYIEFRWGVQGSIQDRQYTIPPSEKIADTGNVFQDYKPTEIYLSRMFYRGVWAFRDGDYSGNTVDLFIGSGLDVFQLDYSIENYPGYKEFYVIGTPPY